MTNYLNKVYNWQSAEIVAAYDDMPTWSAMPGNALLETIEYAPNKTIVDIGFGTGYPLLQLAERFGTTCSLYGVDVWEEATKQAQLKAERRVIKNITFLTTDATTIGLGNDTVDIVTSNLGINNFAEPEKVIAECKRILKPNGKLYLATNLVGTFAEFYTVFESVLANMGEREVLQQLQTHINSRATTSGVHELFDKHNFKVEQQLEKSYTLTYANGTAFLNDYFIVMAFLPSWKAIVPTEKQVEVFTALEDELNKSVQQNKGLKLTIPYAVYKFIKA